MLPGSPGQDLSEGKDSADTKNAQVCKGQRPWFKLKAVFLFSLQTGLRNLSENHLILPSFCLAEGMPPAC